MYIYYMLSVKFVLVMWVYFPCFCITYYVEKLLFQAHTCH